MQFFFGFLLFIYFYFALSTTGSIELQQLLYGKYPFQFGTMLLVKAQLQMQSSIVL